ncbi:sugar ABC transporter ATP-binding protein [Pseudohoeflea suaedae]|uniref:Sugar ABC transporter ATP-binding protein n=1 Tax=Pseudohoeflea suaedae TaxID=877384 RepID=A0A4R5PN17_9HYPH|nr:sugar ABC transporter ATP-binding protein [Pseudohoeflea suaedae]TDH37897.1 sugar ABC transporter ATP-binding protein [Pseudohoeflea suaedae]
MTDMTAPADSLPLVRFEAITKHFGGTVALAGVTFEVRHGETLGLLGSNGAGKSTLIKILSGMQPQTGGDILIEGVPQTLDSPVDARDCGIVTVHQNIDDGVVFGMTVAENLVLDNLSVAGGNPWMPYGRVRRQAAAILEELDFDLPLDVPVEQLSASGRQEVSIARALVKKPKLLILDEPTSTLSARESERLFERVAAMQARGIAILYVSHRMSDIQRLCHRAVVLRNGQVVSNHDAPLDARAITVSILGEIALAPAFESRTGRETVLSGEGLRVSRHGPAFDVSFRRGEIVGLTGLVGAGKTELLEQFYGARPLVSGKLELLGQPFEPRDQPDALAHGIAMVPEERAAQSIFPGEQLTTHASIGRLDRFSTAGIMQRSEEVAFARKVISDFHVRCPGHEAPIEALSGGNQQKLLVGRWLADEREVMILDEPFRGIDIGARSVIAKALRAYSENTAVIVCSSDPEEVIEVADRVLVMRDGEIVCDIASSEISAEQLADIMSAAPPSQAHPTTMETNSVH